MSNYPSSLPLCVRFPGHFLRFGCGDLSALASLKRYVFRDSMRDPPRGSHLKPFWIKIVFSHAFGAHVFSRPRFLSSGLRFGHTCWQKTFLSRVWGHFSFSTFAKCYRTRAGVRFRYFWEPFGCALLLQNSREKQKKTNSILVRVL